MPLREANRKWHWRFQVDGVIYRGSTDLAATPRNRSAALRVEHDAQQKVLAGQATSLKVKTVPFTEAADRFLDWAAGKHREHPGTARRLRVSPASCRRFFQERPVAASRPATSRITKRGGAPSMALEMSPCATTCTPYRSFSATP